MNCVATLTEDLGIKECLVYSDPCKEHGCDRYEGCRCDDITRAELNEMYDEEAMLFWGDIESCGYTSCECDLCDEVDNDRY